MQVATIALFPEHNDPVQDLPGFTHAFADVNGTRLHYVTGGQGPLIMLLHGWPFNWAEWRLLMPHLVQLGYRVVAPDLRGFGASAMPDDGYRKANVAADIYGLVQTLGETRIGLVGTDIGAMAAHAYAVAYPETLHHLVLAETLIPGYELEERMNPATGGYWHFGFQMQVELATMLTSGKEAEYLMPMWQMMSVAADAQQQARQYYLPYFIRPGAMRAGFRHYAALLDDGHHNREALSVQGLSPVLVLSAEKGIPQEQTCASVRRMGIGFASDTVPNAGHNFAHDNPIWVAQRLHCFLKDNN